MSNDPVLLHEKVWPHRHLLGIEGLTAAEITEVLDLADLYVGAESARG